jgi:hypothetical protein
MDQPTDQYVLIKPLERLIDRDYKSLAREILAQLGNIDCSLTPKIIQLVHSHTHSLVREIVRTTYRLPLHTHLPPELVVKIFSYLSFSDLCRAERVCKQWRELIKHAWLMKRRFAISVVSLRVSLGVLVTRCPNIRFVDFGGYFLSVRTRDIVTSIALNCPNIEEVNLNFQNKIVDEQIEALFVHCTKLKKLDLTCGKSINGECLLYARNMTYIALNHCSEIKNMDLVHQFLKNNKTTLVSFHFRNYLYRYSPAILKFIAEIPSIMEVSLSLTGMNDMDKLAVLPKLEKLDLTCSHLIDKVDLSKLVCKSRSLKFLELDAAKYISDDLFSYGPITAPLEYLNLGYCEALTDLTLHAIVRNVSRSLKTLKMCQCAGFSADGVVEAAKRMPQLTLIDVSLINKFEESHLLSIVEAYEGKPWVVCVTCISNDINYKNFYEALLCKSSVRSEVRVKRVSHIFYDIYYKNLKIQLNIENDIDFDDE